MCFFLIHTNVFIQLLQIHSPQTESMTVPPVLVWDFTTHKKNSDIFKSLLQNSDVFIKVG